MKSPRPIEPLSLFLKIGLLVGIAWVLLTAARLQPDPRGYGTHESMGLEPCGWLQSHGSPCISCGMTTAFAWTVRLDLVHAFRASPAGMLLCLVFMAAPAWIVHSLLTGMPALRFMRGRWAWLIPIVAVVVVLASWAYKVATYRSG